MATWTDQTKNSASWSNASVNSATFTNEYYKTGFGARYDDVDLAYDALADALGAVYYDSIGLATVWTNQSET